MKRDVFIIYLALCLNVGSILAQSPFEPAIFPVINAPSSSCSFVDVNQDGYLDLFITIGEKEFNNQFYWGTQNGTFQPASIPALTDKSPNFYSYSGAWGDYDNDGDLDVYVSNNNYTTLTGQNCFLIRNDGGNNFTRLTGNKITDDINPCSYGATWGDYNNDGLLDLFIANTAGKSVLYENNGNNDFQKINLPGVLNEDGAIGGSWIDYNGDDCLDLYVLNRYRRENNVLLKNNCDGTFTVVDNILANLGVNAIFRSSRSINWSDLDRDGDLDAAITDYEHASLLILENRGGDDFYFRSTLQQYGRASVLVDVDNDGWDDIVATDPYQLRYFHNNKNFSFAEKIINQQDFNHPAPWALCAGDYDNDGKADLFVACRFDNYSGAFTNNVLLKNVDANCNNWLSIAFDQRQTNRFAIGAKIWCYFKENSISRCTYKQVQASHTGNYQSYFGQYMHMGLGEEVLVDSIVVRWPNRITTRYFSVKANQRITLHDDGRIDLGNSIDISKADTLQIKVFSIDVDCERKVAYLYYDYPVDWYDATTNQPVLADATTLLNVDLTHQYYFRTLCQQSDTLDIPKYQRANCVEEKKKCFKELGPVPNLITPNDDGKNESFSVAIDATSPTVSLRVYNQWGSQVFSSDNYKNDWYAEGNADGVYYYYIRMASEENCELKGWVQVLR